MSFFSAFEGSALRFAVSSLEPWLHVEGPSPWQVRLTKGKHITWPDPSHPCPLSNPAGSLANRSLS